MKKDAVLGPCYNAKIPSWNVLRNQKTETTVSFLPIHEVLDVIIPDGSEESWASFNDDQRGFQGDLSDWWDRVGMPELMRNLFLAISIWGDSAVFSNKDSVYAFLWSCLSGPCRRRFWICTFPKKCYVHADAKASALSMQSCRSLIGCFEL